MGRSGSATRPATIWLAGFVPERGPPTAWAEHSHQATQLGLGARRWAASAPARRRGPAAQQGDTHRHSAPCFSPTSLRTQRLQLWQCIVPCLPLARARARRGSTARGSQNKLWCGVTSGLPPSVTCASLTVRRKKSGKHKDKQKDKDKERERERGRSAERAADGEAAKREASRSASPRVTPSTSSSDSASHGHPRDDRRSRSPERQKEDSEKRDKGRHKGDPDRERKRDKDRER
jgi:hypothetical protein